MWSLTSDRIADVPPSHSEVPFESVEASDEEKDNEVEEVDVNSDEDERNVASRKPLVLSRYIPGTRIQYKRPIPGKGKSGPEIVNFYEECFQKYRNEAAFLQRYNVDTRNTISEAPNVESDNAFSKKSSSFPELVSVGSLEMEEKLFMKAETKEGHDVSSLPLQNGVSNEVDEKFFCPKEERSDALYKAIRSISDRLNLQHLLADPKSYLKAGGSDQHYDPNDPFLDDSELYKEFPVQERLGESSDEESSNGSPLFSKTSVALDLSKFVCDNILEKDAVPLSSEDESEEMIFDPKGWRSSVKHFSPKAFPPSCSLAFERLERKLEALPNQRVDTGILRHLICENMKEIFYSFLSTSPKVTKSAEKESIFDKNTVLQTAFKDLTSTQTLPRVQPNKYTKEVEIIDVETIISLSSCDERFTPRKEGGGQPPFSIAYSCAQEEAPSGNSLLTNKSKQEEAPPGLFSSVRPSSVPLEPSKVSLIVNASKTETASAGVPTTSSTAIRKIIPSPSSLTEKVSPNQLFAQVDSAFLRNLVRCYVKITNCMPKSKLYRRWVQMVINHNRHLFWRQEDLFVKRLKSSKVFEEGKKQFVSKVRIAIRQWKHARAHGSTSTKEISKKRLPMHSSVLSHSQNTSLPTSAPPEAPKRFQGVPVIEKTQDFGSLHKPTHLDSTSDAEAISPVSFEKRFISSSVSFPESNGLLARLKSCTVDKNLLSTTAVVSPIRVKPWVCHSQKSEENLIGLRSPPFIAPVAAMKSSVQKVMRPQLSSKTSAKNLVGFQNRQNICKNVPIPEFARCFACIAEDMLKYSGLSAKYCSIMKNISLRMDDFEELRDIQIKESGSPFAKTFSNLLEIMFKKRYDVFLKIPDEFIADLVKIYKELYHIKKIFLECRPLQTSLASTPPKKLLKPLLSKKCEQTFALTHNVNFVETPMTERIVASCKDAISPEKNSLEGGSEHPEIEKKANLKSFLQSSTSESSVTSNDGSLYVSLSISTSEGSSCHERVGYEGKPPATALLIDFQRKRKAMEFQSNEGCANLSVTAIPMPPLSKQRREKVTAISSKGKTKGENGSGSETSSMGRDIRELYRNISAQLTDKIEKTTQPTTSEEANLEGSVRQHSVTAAKIALSEEAQTFPRLPCSETEELPDSPCLEAHTVAYEASKDAPAVLMNEEGNTGISSSSAWLGVLGKNDASFRTLYHSDVPVEAEMIHDQNVIHISDRTLPVSKFVEVDPQTVTLRRDKKFYFQENVLHDNISTNSFDFTMKTAAAVPSQRVEMPRKQDFSENNESSASFPVDANASLFDRIGATDTKDCPAGDSLENRNEPTHLVENDVSISPSESSRIEDCKTFSSSLTRNLKASSPPIPLRMTDIEDIRRLQEILWGAGMQSNRVSKLVTKFPASYFSGNMNPTFQLPIDLEIWYRGENSTDHSIGLQLHSVTSIFQQEVLVLEESWNFLNRLWTRSSMSIKQNTPSECVAISDNRISKKAKFISEPLPQFEAHLSLNSLFKNYYLSSAKSIDPLSTIESASQDFPPSQYPSLETAVATIHFVLHTAGYNLVGANPSCNINILFVSVIDALRRAKEQNSSADYFSCRNVFSPSEVIHAIEKFSYDFYTWQLIKIKGDPSFSLYEFASFIGSP
ncbi:hypothetical protein IE077_002533 [Cardiosporidium cionae]|uniref:Hpc2-related domain-containing protein n=1 Tax=Cardiosporidium cionae TaxID=476202 RepID=A0ABQ7JG00_9APIC|nr:hypothetical protein IE077_002533 [Cardiosporidium cionae]|eukprot:KAF8822809.1 hypothetical protein IE077_002533 [Cardiosporidium cionae]